MRDPRSVGNDISGILLDASHTWTISMSSNLHVSVVSPASAPGESQDVVVLTILRGVVAHQVDSLVNCSAARVCVKDS